MPPSEGDCEGAACHQKVTESGGGGEGRRPSSRAPRRSTVRRRARRAGAIRRRIDPLSRAASESRSMNGRVKIMAIHHGLARRHFLGGDVPLTGALFVQVAVIPGWCRT